MPGLFFSVIRRQLVSTLFPYTTLFRSRAGTMTFCVPVPSSGSYGIAVRHDLDGDGETDLSSDGGGMSNNPSINIFNLGKPSYTKTAISVDGVKSIRIKMRYM